MTNSSTYEYDVFISYNQNDEAWARALATRLEQEDWQGRKLKVFFAPWDIKPGQSILQRLEYGLPRSRKVCLIMTPESGDSVWVTTERHVTQHMDITERAERLIPLYRRACEIPPFLKHINQIDFQDDAKFEDGYRVLLPTIKDEPQPRGVRQSSAGSLPPLIPRPPIVGFVVRRDSEGRDIVERLKAELAPNKNQLIVLSGPGGVGKTTLAAETARALSDDFRDRLIWISALGREDFALSTLLDGIATQLGHPELRPLAAERKAEQVQALIAATPALVILDNFETIKPDQQTHCVDFLFNHASCPALITTRQRIGSARNIVIPAMSQSEADEFLQRLIDEASDPSAFAGIDRDRIMKASERNPLVLQWVAAQIDLAQGSDTVLDELAHGVGDAAQRVFDRSFNLEQLGDDGRAALLALSLFVPDASRASLAEVAGFTEDLSRLNDALKRLSGLWLVKTAARGSRMSVEGLTRELAKARLLKDDITDDFRQRLVTCFLSYAEVHSQPTPENFDALEIEKDNVLSAMDAAFSMKDCVGVMQLMDAISFDGVNGYLNIRGFWDEATRRGEQALECARNLSDESEIARFSHNLAISCQARGELDEARRLYNESLEIKKKLGNQDGIASGLHQLASLAQDQGELDEARRLYNESLEIDKKLGNQGGIAYTWHNLAAIAHDQGELDEAMRLQNESLEMKKRLGNQEGIASGLHQLARLAQVQGELEEARRLYNESLEINKRLGNQGVIAITMWALGILAEDEANNAEAARLYEEALAIFERLKSPKAEIIRKNLARVKGKSSE